GKSMELLPTHLPMPGAIVKSGPFELFDEAPIALRCLDREGVILRANQADLDLLGYASEDYVGHNIAEFHVDPDVARDMLATFARGEALHDRLVLLRQRDGTTRQVL